jgi:hypothetical protein
LVVLTLLGPGCQTDCLVQLTTQSPLPDGRVGQAYFLQFQATSSCTPGADLEWMERGGLPPGMKLSKDGALDGRPTEAGTFTFRVGAFIFDIYDEFKGQTEDSREYTLTILPR